MEASYLDTSQKLIAMGGGLVFVGVMIVIGIVRRWLPDKNRARRLWAVAVPALIIGLTLVAIGLF